MSLRTRSGLDIAIASTRPTFLPDKSICRRLPGFTNLSVVIPDRSPLAVADFLAPIVSGRSFTEIGTRNGDIMGCLAHFAKVTAIELDANYCKKLRERGFEVVCRAVETVSATDLPAGDVYFWWPMWSPRQNEAWLRQLMQVHRDSGRRAVAYIAHDSHWAPDMQTLKRLTPHYRATNVTRIFFDEGDVAQAGTGRPGKWGVFHMARFELGGELPPRQGRRDLAPALPGGPSSRIRLAQGLLRRCGDGRRVAARCMRARRKGFRAPRARLRHPHAPAVCRLLLLAMQAVSIRVLQQGADGLQLVQQMRHEPAATHRERQRGAAAVRNPRSVCGDGSHDAVIMRDHGVLWPHVPKDHPGRVHRANACSAALLACVIVLDLVTALFCSLLLVTRLVTPEFRVFQP